MKRAFLVLLILTVFIVSGCSQQPVETPSPTPTPTPKPTPIPAPLVTPYDGPLIDAHSQVDQYVDLARVIQLMNQGGVAYTILSTRGTVTPAELVSFADNHPGRIIPAVRTKSYIEETSGKYPKRSSTGANPPKTHSQSLPTQWTCEVRTLWEVTSGAGCKERAVFLLCLWHTC